MFSVGDSVRVVSLSEGFKGPFYSQFLNKVGVVKQIRRLYYKPEMDIYSISFPGNKGWISFYTDELEFATHKSIEDWE